VADHDLNPLPWRSRGRGSRARRRAQRSCGKRHVHAASALAVDQGDDAIGQAARMTSTGTIRQRRKPVILLTILRGVDQRLRAHANL